MFPFNDDERRLQPGRLEIGTRDGEPVTVEVTDLSGVALTGPTAEPVARALLAAVVVRAGPRAAEVLLTEDLAGRCYRVWQATGTYEGRQTATTPPG